MKIPLDLAEILRIRKLDWKMFIWLFVCLFVFIATPCRGERPEGSGFGGDVKMKIDVIRAVILTEKHPVMAGL